MSKQLLEVSNFNIVKTKDSGAWAFLFDQKFLFNFWLFPETDEKGKQLRKVYLKNIVREVLFYFTFS